jgi:hypothetical protein
MPAIASLEDLKSAQKEDLSIYAMRGSVRLTTHALRLTVSEMAQDRLEECM